ncbi:hypothetical protein EPO04_02415 [Patescibacteria group bacterium]|nr:MAG: hypothetical protein EPO04_02415 [Patescibacteria group bacterium]
MIAQERIDQSRTELTAWLRQPRLEMILQKDAPAFDPQPHVGVNVQRGTWLVLNFHPHYRYHQPPSDLADREQVDRYLAYIESLEGALVGRFLTQFQSLAMQRLQAWDEPSVLGADWGNVLDRLQQVLNVQVCPGVQQYNDYFFNNGEVAMVLPDIWLRQEFATGLAVKLLSSLQGDLVKINRYPVVFCGYGVRFI